MADQHVVTVSRHHRPEAVAGAGRGHGRPRLHHLFHRVGGQHVVGLAQQHPPEGHEVGGGGPELPGGGHGRGIVGGLGQQRASPRVHGPALGGGGGGSHRRAAQAEGGEDPRRHDVGPGGAPLACHQLAEGGVADVGVVVAAPLRGPVAIVVQVGGDAVPGPTRRALPPGRGGLGPHPAGVGQQLAHGAAGQRAEPGQPPLHRVGEAQPPLVAQLQHGHGGEGLGDGPDAVLGVRTGRRGADPSPARRPDHPPAPPHRRHQRGERAVHLRPGRPGQQLAGRHRVERLVALGHRPALPSPPGCSPAAGGEHRAAA